MDIGVRAVVVVVVVKEGGKVSQIPEEGVGPPFCCTVGWPSSCDASVVSTVTVVK